MQCGNMKLKFNLGGIHYKPMHPTYKQSNRRFLKIMFSSVNALGKNYSTHFTSHMPDLISLIPQTLIFGFRKSN